MLTGYRYSVYTWIARMALAEKGLEHGYREADPYSNPPPQSLMRLHPFARVPVLDHDGFILYETAAILRYVDAQFPDPCLTPKDPLAMARMVQVISIFDNYGYWPLIRQVFAHSVFRPLEGEDPVPEELAAGLAAAPRVLGALETIAVEGRVLASDVTFADLHLGPMLAYFALAKEGEQMLTAYPALTARLAALRQRPAFRATEPVLTPR